VATNLILAFAGAAGVFAAVLALGMRPRARLEDIGGLIEPRPGPIERLQHKLTEAGLEVTAGEFIRVSLLLGGGVALAAYLITTAWAPALLGFAVGGLVYTTYLADRRDRRRQDYQDGLVDVIGLLVEGFRAGNTLQAAFESVARYGPEIAREDWAQVNARIRTGIPVEDALMELSRRRRDPILDTVAQTLVVVSKQGGRLSVALIGLQDTVRERVRIRRRVQAEQSQPMWELRLVAALPFLAIPVLRAVAEGGVRRLLADPARATVPAALLGIDDRRLPGRPAVHRLRHAGGGVLRRGRGGRVCRTTPSWLAPKGQGSVSMSVSE